MVFDNGLFDLLAALISVVTQQLSLVASRVEIVELQDTAFLVTAQVYDYVVGQNCIYWLIYNDLMLFLWF